MEDIEEHNKKIQFRSSLKLKITPSLQNYIKRGLITFCLVFLPLFLISFNFNNNPRTKELKHQADSAYHLALNKRYYEAVKLSEDVLTHYDDLTDTIKALTYTTLGIAYKDISHEKSIKYLEKATHYYEQLHDTIMLIEDYATLAFDYKEEHDIERSNEYYRKALALSEDFDKYPRLVYVACELAGNLVHNHTGYEEAEAYLLKILDVCENNEKFVNDEYIRSHAYLYLGEIYTDTKECGKAHKLLQKAMPILEKNHYVHELKELYYYEAELYKYEGNYEKAMEMMKPYTEISDSLLAHAHDEEIRMNKAEFRLRKKREKLDSVSQELEIEHDLHIKNLQFSIGASLIGLLLFGILIWSFKQNRKVKQSKEKIEKLSAAKSEFYSEMSHELRTPLYAVIELSSLLLKEDVKSEQLEYLNSLNFSGNYLLNLVNNILKNNEIEHGEIRIEERQFELKNTLQNIVDAVEVAIKDNKNKVYLEYDEKIPHFLQGDELKISQILMNLVSNANKFTTNGKVTVIAQQKAETKDQVTIYFEVTDTGTGIAQEKQELIFQEFYQGEDNKNQKYKGTGLGLSIVKKILAAMNSEIAVESKKGKGTKFFFELNIKKQHEEEKILNTIENNLKFLENKNFLVVDDNKINQLVSTKVLHRLGLECKSVSSGQEAIDILKEEKFDCILMDLNMPEMDGFEASKIITSHHKDVAVVALTASSVEEFSEKIEPAGMIGYILKPFELEDFVATISQAVRVKNS